MFRLIKQVSIGQLSYNTSLSSKCMSLINKICMTRPTVINLNSFKFNYYVFMISLDKCNGICNNAIDDFFLQKHIFQVKQKV